MTKALVAGIWIVGLVLLVPGIMLAIIGVEMSGSSVNLQHGHELRSFLDSYGGTAGGIVAIAGLIAIAVGGLLQFMAWILAMVATATLNRWGWFVGLLVMGVIGLEFLAMLAYVLTGPSERATPRTLTPA